MHRGQWIISFFSYRLSSIGATIANSAIVAAVAATIAVAAAAGVWPNLILN